MARLISISFVVLDWSPARPLGVMGLTVTHSAGLCLTVTGLGLCYNRFSAMIPFQLFGLKPRTT